jgi:predicted RNase H-like HicB family nuclease
LREYVFSTGPTGEELRELIEEAREELREESGLNIKITNKALIEALIRKYLAGQK